MLPFTSRRSSTLPMSNLSYFASRTPSATFSKSQNNAMLCVSVLAAIVGPRGSAARLAADDFDLHPAIRCVADDLFHARQCIAIARLGQRLRTALALGPDALGVDAVRHQILLDRFGAALGQPFVHRRRAGRIAVADDAHSLEVELFQPRDQLIELLASERLDARARQRKQRTGVERELFVVGLGD